MEKTQTTVYNIIMNSDCFYNGVKLLSCKAEYPEFTSPFYVGVLSRVNDYLRSDALEFQNYCATELFDRAVDQYVNDMKNNFPLREFEALLTYKITYLSSCIISMYFDRYEYTGGAHGITTRYSWTYNLQKGKTVALRSLITCPPDYKKYILKAVREEIERDPSIYFENYETLISDTFNSESFYCTPQGIVVYYQHYDIAPYSSGIREFLLPYSECVKDPKTMCRRIKNL